ncbi:MAG: thiamine pyrophosphate-binding protein [Desulfomonilia bacterium]
MNHIDRLANEICEQGVNNVFGIPGSGPSLALLDALEKKGINFHLTHTESSAVLMAGAGAKLSGKAGVAIAIKGPGLSNQLPGIATCFLDAWPVLAISEAFHPDTMSHVAHKRMDHATMVKAITKFSCFWGGGSATYRELAAFAESERPGPVHIDIADKPVESRSTPLFSEGKNHTCMPERISSILSDSLRPVMIVGTLAVRRGISHYLDALQIPVFTTAAAKGAINEHLSQAAGVYTGVGDILAPEASIISKADLIIGIGLRPEELLGVHSFSCKCLFYDVVNINVAPWRRNSEFCGFSEGIIEGLFDILQDKRWGIEEITRCMRLLRQNLIHDAFLPASIISQVESSFNCNARLVLDTGNFCTVAEHVWRVPKAELYLAAGQGRYMGVGLPLAIGAAIHDSSVPTVLFTGDGGIGMYIAELKLAVALNLPLLVILLSDGHLGTILGASIKRGLSRSATVIHQPSWDKIIDNMGIESYRIESMGDLGVLLSSWDRKNPLYLEAHFDPFKYQAMTEKIR